jgi:hypothetical protein
VSASFPLSTGEANLSGYETVPEAASHTVGLHGRTLARSNE